MKYVIHYSENMNEKLGIPEGNIEVATEVFDLIVEDFSKIKDKSVMDKTEDGIGIHSLYIDKKYTIKDKEVHGVDLRFKFFPDGDEIIFIGMSITNLRYSGYGYTDPPRGDYSKKSNIEIRFLIPKSGESTFGEILRSIENDEDDFFSSLSHEFKHFYDSAKVRQSFSSLAKYQIPDLVKFGIPAIDDFLFFFYLIHKSEGLVRPSEMGSIIKKRGIKKQDFLNFFNENKLVKKIKKIGDWTYEKMKKNLLDEVEIIKRRLDQSNIPYPERDEEIVELILDLLHSNILSEGSKALDKLYLRQDPIGRLRRMLFAGNSSDPWDSSLEEFLKKMKKEDYNAFFKETEKLFQRESKKVLRKLAKLYDLAESEILDLEEKKSSIVNMEAHWKMKRVSPKILDFRQFRKK